MVQKLREEIGDSNHAISEVVNVFKFINIIIFHECLIPTKHIKAERPVTALVIVA